MNRPQQSLEIHSITRARMGIASLELALALPILLILLSIIFGVCSVAECRMQVSTAARNQAFEKRHTPWLHNPERLELGDSAKVSTILGDQPKMPADSGLVSGSANGQPEKLFGPLAWVKWTSTSQRSVMGGGWDLQEIEFARHKVLTLTEKAKYFGLDEQKLQSFERLASFGGAGAAGATFMATQRQAQQALQAGQQSLATRLTQIQQSLQTKRQELKKLQQKLELAKKAPEPNRKSIDQLQTAIRQTQNSITTLKTEQTYQQKAQSALGFDLTLPGEQSTGEAEEAR